MARTCYETNYRGLGELLRSSEVAAFLRGPAMDVLAAAKSNAANEKAFRSVWAKLSAWPETHPSRVVYRIGVDDEHGAYAEASTGLLSRTLG